MLSDAPTISDTQSISAEAPMAEDDSDTTVLLRLQAAFGSVSPSRFDPAPVADLSRHSQQDNAHVHALPFAGNDACLLLTPKYQSDDFHGPEVAYCSRDDWLSFLAQANTEFSMLPEDCILLLLRHFMPCQCLTVLLNLTLLVTWCSMWMLLLLMEALPGL